MKEKGSKCEDRDLEGSEGEVLQRRRVKGEHREKGDEEMLEEREGRVKERHKEEAGGRHRGKRGGEGTVELQRKLLSPPGWDSS